MKLNLKTWILLGYALMALIVIILSGFSIYFIERLNNASSSILKDNYRSIEDAYRMIDNIDKIDNSQALLLSKSPADINQSKEEFKDAAAKFEDALNAAENNVTEPGESDLIKSLRTEYVKYLNMTGADDSLRGPNYYAKLLPQYKLVKAKCYELLKMNEIPMLRKNEYSRVISRETELYMIFIAIASVLIAAVAMVRIPGNVTNPILALTKKVEAISQKKYSERLEVKSDNELGKLAGSFNKMAEKLNEYEESNIAKLLAEKKRTEAIVVNMRDGIIVIDELNEVILVNDVGVELLGLARDEIIGRNIYKASEENNLLKNLIADLEETTKEHKSEKLSYLRIVHRDREEYFLKEINKVYDKSDVDKNLGIIIVLKNVTGFKELDEIKSGFVATVSHELKTPLAAMNMSLRLLQDSRMGELNAEQKKITDAMKEEVKRLLKMVNELLNLSKLESGGEVYKYQLLSIEDIIDSAVTPMLMQFEQGKLSFEMDVEPELPRVKVDGNKIAWVLINLLGNAIRYSHEGGEINLVVKNRGNHVEFCVKDNGIGIKPEYISRIFDKFVQIKHSNIEKQNKGVGLGLAISREFVEAHGGKIWAKSEPSKGSEFYFTIPV